MIPPFTITETHDPESVWRIVTDVSVFNRVCDDAWLAKSLDEVKAVVTGVVTNSDNHVLSVVSGGVVLGCFVCYRMAEGVYEVHTFLTDACRGEFAIAAGKAAMKFMFGLPGVEKLISVCPQCLPESYWFARRCGWRNVGIGREKWVKFGVEYPVQQVEITKGDICH